MADTTHFTSSKAHDVVLLYVKKYIYLSAKNHQEFSIDIAIKNNKNKKFMPKRSSSIIHYKQIGSNYGSLHNGCFVILQSDTLLIFTKCSYK